MRREGILCCIAELIVYSGNLPDIVNEDERIILAWGLLVVAAFVFLFVYRIRVFLRVIRVFGLRRRWILLMIFFEWLAMLLLGAGKKYQPTQYIPADEDWMAGTAPAQLGTAHGQDVLAQTSGLSVDLADRSVKDMNKTRYLLKDISLHIPNGSLVLLLGGSGSGKTTFVNALTGYEKANAKVILNGMDVYEQYEQIKYRIGFVPQKNLIRGNDTVKNTISDAAMLRLPENMPQQDRDSRIGSVMETLGLTAGSDGLVGKKSGGMLRRISIALELVSDPELFILDEPDSGLDGVVARELFEKLRSIADDGRIVIAITHTPDRVADLFDKVIVLARDSGRVGRLAFYGSPDEARSFFGKESMEGIIRSINKKEDGGEGKADESIARFAAMTAGRAGAANE
ncbi:MAG: ABC transporter ATP-binding protein [Lachnospiraceae bacterium]|nr:ABC transporter ATP-binding protein [Lachnospiraceae bacterium]